MLEGAPLRASVVDERPLYKKFGAGRLSRAMRETEVPALAGCGRVDRGFGFGTVASEGWGGGVARCKSSLRVYVPVVLRQNLLNNPVRGRNAKYVTFSDQELPLGARWV